MTISAHLMIIDPQISFCWQGLEKMGVDQQAWGKVASVLISNGYGSLAEALFEEGSLFVPGSPGDMTRLAKLIWRLLDTLSAITVTMDSHHQLDQAHQLWWMRESDGASPDPLTILGEHNGQVVKFIPNGSGGLDPTNEVYVTRNPSALTRGGCKGTGSLGYLKELKKQNRYSHVIWPDHCLIGSFGQTIHPAILDAVHGWERRQVAWGDYVTKGSQPHSEHYSAVRAEVIHAKDRSTQVNSRLIKNLKKVKNTIWGGEAFNFCMANTGLDVAEEFQDEELIGGMIFLTDCSSNVQGFEHLSDVFVQKMERRGAKFMTSDEVYPHITGPQPL